MSKIAVAHADQAKNADGTYNIPHMIVEGTKALHNILGGHTKVDSFTQVAHPSGNAKSRRFVLDVTDKD